MKRLLNKLGLYTREQYENVRICNEAHNVFNRHAIERAEELKAEKEELSTKLEAECHTSAELRKQLDLASKPYAGMGLNEVFAKAFQVALGEYGVTEYGEKGAHNPRILEYHKATSLGASDDETPWCSAFVNWCLKRSGLIGTGKANARSFLTWGKEANGDLGDIVVFWRGEPKGWKGHVGFVVARHNGFVYTLGGNQGNKVCVSAYPESRVLGYRKA